MHKLCKVDMIFFIMIQFYLILNEIYQYDTILIN